MASLGVPTVVLDGETGLLSKEGDSIAYGENLKTLLVNPSLRARLGKAGSRHIQQAHGIKAAAGIISTALERL